MRENVRNLQMMMKNIIKKMIFQVMVNRVPLKTENNKENI